VGTRTVPRDTGYNPRTGLGRRGEGLGRVPRAGCWPSGQGDAFNASSRLDVGLAATSLSKVGVALCDAAAACTLGADAARRARCDTSLAFTAGRDLSVVDNGSYAAIGGPESPRATLQQTHALGWHRHCGTNLREHSIGRWHNGLRRFRLPLSTTTQRDDAKGVGSSGQAPFRRTACPMIDVFLVARWVAGSARQRGRAAAQASRSQTAHRRRRRRRAARWTDALAARTAARLLARPGRRAESDGLLACVCAARRVGPPDAA
jgi:hypothetical protein